MTELAKHAPAAAISRARALPDRAISKTDVPVPSPRFWIVAHGAVSIGLPLATRSGSRADVTASGVMRQRRSVALKSE
jgi:hypothetical protein